LNVVITKGRADGVVKNFGLKYFRKYF